MGAFLQKFDASAFAKDTILVFTSDHATYPGRDFTELFGEYDYFVGETKLITEAFGDLFSKLKKRGFRDTYYFLSVAYEAYTHDVFREITQKQP